MPKQLTERCERIRSNGETCTNEAVFLVSIGTRKFDGQRSCSLHLGRTVAALIGAEGENGSIKNDRSATVKWYPNGIAKKASDE